MSCISCSSERIASIGGKCSDLCWVQIGNNEHDGYVPIDMEIGGGDNIKFDYCLDCGKIQGTFPVPETKLEQSETEEEDNDEE